MGYKYGANAHLDKSVVKSSLSSSTVVVYVGTLPINLIRGYENSNIINFPIKVENMSDALRKVGYSADWDNFTLSEVLTAHFDNELGNIGPVILINVLDPEKHKKVNKTQVNLEFVNNKVEIKSDTIILDSFAIDGKVEGVDYTLEYVFRRGVVVVTALTELEEISASYDEVDPTAVSIDDVIGKVTDLGEYEGIGAIGLVYQELGLVPNILLVPKFSTSKEVYETMVEACHQVNGHWEAVAYADIPIVDDGEKVDAISKAISWKSENGFNKETSKVFWPMMLNSAGRKLHLSIQFAVETLRTDLKNGGIPFETAANKQVAVARHYFGDSPNKGYDQQTANTLTAQGITTAVKWGGEWVLWGDHTAAYYYTEDDSNSVDKRSIFDVNIRMLFHIVNNFQTEWGPEIDRPMTKQYIDTIINREQDKLEALKAMNALIGNPTVDFIESENSASEIMQGNFRWDLDATPTPPLKSATAYVSYTDAGYSSYLERGE